MIGEDRCCVVTIAVVVLLMKLIVNFVGYRRCRPYKASSGFSFFPANDVGEDVTS